MQMRFDKHLESHIFGQAPFVCRKAAPSEVFLKDICFLGTALHSQQGEIPATVSLSKYLIKHCSEVVY